MLRLEASFSIPTLPCKQIQIIWYYYCPSLRTPMCNFGVYPSTCWVLGRFRLWDQGACDCWFGRHQKIYSKFVFIFNFEWCIVTSIGNIEVKWRKGHGDKLGGDLVVGKIMVKCNVQCLEMRISWWCTFDNLVELKPRSSSTSLLCNGGHKWRSLAIG